MAFLIFRRPSGAPLPVSPGRRRGFALTSLWRIFLPVAIAAIAGAILVSDGDPEKRPFWIFGAGVACGLVGLVSLFAGLIQAGNVERARRRERDRLRAAPDAGRKTTSGSKPGGNGPSR